MNGQPHSPSASQVSESAPRQAGRCSLAAWNGNLGGRSPHTANCAVVYYGVGAGFVIGTRPLLTVSRVSGEAMIAIRMMLLAHQITG